MFKSVLCLILVFLNGACVSTPYKAPLQSVPTHHADAATQGNRQLLHARALERRGNHLEASFYYEAILAIGGREQLILPQLIRAQVRAGRLRAAGDNLTRLREIAETGNPNLENLSNLLARYTATSRPRTNEIRP
jgi:hypothetical protein